jgi:hypothetical protein
MIGPANQEYLDPGAKTARSFICKRGDTKWTNWYQFIHTREDCRHKS